MYGSTLEAVDRQKIQRFVHVQHHPLIKHDSQDGRDLVLTADWEKGSHFVSQLHHLRLTACNFYPTNQHTVMDTTGGRSLVWYTGVSVSHPTHVWIPTAVSKYAKSLETQCSSYKRSWRCCFLRTAVARHSFCDSGTPAIDASRSIRPRTLHAQSIRVLCCCPRDCRVIKKTAKSTDAIFERIIVPSLAACDVSQSISTSFSLTNQLPRYH